ncbi:hypothetical protein Aca07nite_87110 [Actinoplanes capillaceus]|uniref:Uncharacterized protein n=1 Tax=Actinoplanes campanulatus TaxID=113559 RepID=A0ABQ3WYS2_9ACTN|nr:hypothetical protein Aca07nite_87110 [Actinoplanes capillaceus]
MDSGAEPTDNGTPPMATDDGRTPLDSVVTVSARQLVDRGKPAPYSGHGHRRGRMAVSVDSLHRDIRMDSGITSRWTRQPVDGQRHGTATDNLSTRAFPRPSVPWTGTVDSARYGADARSPIHGADVDSGPGDNGRHRHRSQARRWWHIDRVLADLGGKVNHCEAGDR